MIKADVEGESAIFEALCALGLRCAVGGNGSWVADSGGWAALIAGSIVGSCSRCDFFFVIADNVKCQLETLRMLHCLDQDDSGKR